MRISEGEKKRKQNRKNIWKNNDWEFPKINVRYQSIDSESSENTIIKARKTTLRHITYKLQKIKDKEKILKEATGQGVPYLQNNKYKNCIWSPLRNHASKKRVE